MFVVLFVQTTSLLTAHPALADYFDFHQGVYADSTFSIVTIPVTSSRLEIYKESHLHSDRSGANICFSGFPLFQVVSNPKIFYESIVFGAPYIFDFDDYGWIGDAKFNDPGDKIVDLDSDGYPGPYEDWQVHWDPPDFKSGQSSNVLLTKGLLYNDGGTCVNDSYQVTVLVWS